MDNKKVWFGVIGGKLEYLKYGVYDEDEIEVILMFLLF